MPPLKHISSTQNPEVRQLQHWTQKARDRRKSGLFVLEGLRELRLALEGGYRAETLYFCPEILAESTLRALPGADGVPLVSLSPDVYAHLAYRGKTEGVISLMHARPHGLADLAVWRKEGHLVRRAYLHDPRLDRGGDEIAKPQTPPACVIERAA